MRILVVEDSEYRIKLFRQHYPSMTLAVNYDEAVKLLRKNTYDVIFLDHDLEPGHYSKLHVDGTGYAVAKYLKELNLKEKPAVIIHSLNPVGAERIHNILWREFPTYRKPYGDTGFWNLIKE